MARQPIHDKDLHVVGYELLYRSTDLDSAEPMSAEDRARALANVLVELGLKKLCDSKTAFINVPAILLETKALRLLPANQVVLELPDNLEFDERILSTIRSLTRAGYKIAFDDYCFDPKQEPFLPHVKVVKVDVLTTPKDTLAARVKELKQLSVKLVAQKVETIEMFRACVALGFDHFQGYFFEKPFLIKGRTPTIHKRSALTVVAKLCDPELGIDEIEDMISKDVALTFRLLKLVNSASFGMVCEITSLRQAIMFVGVEKISALASLLVMSSIPGKSAELTTSAIVRARICEHLAEILGYENPKKHFTVGLLSVLDAIMDQKMAVILEDLPIAHDMAEALVCRDDVSELGQTLRAARSLEQGNWANSNASTFRKLAKTYAEAICWAKDISRPAA